jgi:dTDP-4-dehydrorhamnose 3,5-epimerase
MKILHTDLADLYVLIPKVHTDDRGYFYESYNKRLLDPGYIDTTWVQDNESKSQRGVLRGLHYQSGDHAQAKLVRAVVGEIYDVAVDLRVKSNTYGHWHGEVLSAENKKQLLIPRGFAHGFLVLSDEAIFAYKCDNYYNKPSEGGIIYNDSTLDIPWPIDGALIQVSEKDMILPSFGKHKPIYR